MKVSKDKKKMISSDEKRTVLIWAGVLAVLTLFLLSMNWWGGAARKLRVFTKVEWQKKIKPNESEMPARAIFLDNKYPKDIFFAADRFCAVDREKGKIQWSRKAPKISGPVFISGFGLTFAGKNLLIYDLEKGKKEREVKFERKIRNAVRGKKPNSLILFNGRELIYFDLLGDYTNWKKELFKKEQNRLTGLSASTKLLVAGNEKKVFILDVEKGKTLMTLALEGHEIFAYPAEAIKEYTAIHSTVKNPSKFKGGRTCNMEVYSYLKKGDKVNFEKIFNVKTYPAAASPMFSRLRIYLMSVMENGELLIEAYGFDGKKYWENPTGLKRPEKGRIEFFADNHIIYFLHPQKGIYVVNRKTGKLIHNITISKAGKEQEYLCVIDERKAYLYDKISRAASYIRIFTNQDILDKP